MYRPRKPVAPKTVAVWPMEVSPAVDALASNYIPPRDDLPPCTLIIGLPVLVIWTSCCKVALLWLVEKDARGHRVRQIDRVAAERRHCLGTDSAGPLNGFILGCFGEFNEAQQLST